MNKEKIKVGDIRMNKGTPEVCVQIAYNRSTDKNVIIESEWEDYEEYFLRTRVGMSPESHQVHTLQHFIDILDANQPIKQKEIVKS